MAEPKEKKSQGTQVGGSLNLILSGMYGGQFPIYLTLDDRIVKHIDSILESLQTEGTSIFNCKGSSNRLDEVSVMASVGKDYTKIRCPRLLKEFDYLQDGFDRRFTEYDGDYCFEGEDLHNVPVVKKEQFAANKIFKCPYAK